MAVAAGPRVRERWLPLYTSLLAEWRALEDSLIPPGWYEAFDEGCSIEAQLKHAGRWVSGPASLMGVLGLRSREVQHSQVLGWLLDPYGRHGLGAALLQVFLTRAWPGETLVMDPVEVQLEVACDDIEVGTTRYVDIVVRGSGWTLVIENKIWAGQHGPQLDVYYDALRSSTTRFVYLTPFGHKAWSARDEVRAAYQPMSWRADVMPALRTAVAACRDRTRPPDALAAVTDYLCALEEEIR
jgi:hypothetical protein